jgi:hypothetical protein
MAADLHTTLVAKVTAHLELAQAAVKEWPSIIGIVEGSPPPFVAPDTLHEHIGANQPEHVIRVCRADLERLAQHRPQPWFDEHNSLVACDQCPDQWPCPEVRAIAAVYGVEIDQ